MLLRMSSHHCPVESSTILRISNRSDSTWDWRGSEYTWTICLNYTLNIIPYIIHLSWFHWKCTLHIDSTKVPLHLPLLLLQNHLLHLVGLVWNHVKTDLQVGHNRQRATDTRDRATCGVCWVYTPVGLPFKCSTSLAICFQSTHAKEQRIIKNPREHSSPFVSLSSTEALPSCHDESYIHTEWLPSMWVGLKVLDLRTNKPKREWSTTVWNSLCRARYTYNKRQTRDVPPTQPHTRPMVCSDRGP